MKVKGVRPGEFEYGGIVHRRRKEFERMQREKVGDFNEVVEYFLPLN